MNCQYQYDIQPGPTSEICPFQGHSETALILQCQVSSERGTNFSIVWHNTTSIPDRSNIFDHETIIANSSTTVINTTMATSLQNTQLRLTSQLTLKGFDEKGTGYYWCVVNSSSNDQMQNPSVILHIVHDINVHCKANNEQPCNGDISLYMSSSSRCADQATNIKILEAQNCLNPITQEDEKQIGTSFPTNPNLFIHTTSNQQSVAPITTILHITNSQPTPQENVSTSAPKFQLSMGVIIGASMGGFMLILFIVIVLLLVCVVKMKRKHRIREHRLDAPTSPFDDIRMYSSIAKLTQEKVDDPNRISKLYCESNTAYECSPTVASSQTENIYEYIN